MAGDQRTNSRRGRPELPAEERRSHSVRVRLTADEFRWLKRRARQGPPEQRTAAAVIRRLIQFARETLEAG